MSNYSLFGEFQIAGTNLAKRKNDKYIYIHIFYLHKNIKSIKNIKIKILRHYQHNTSNSCSKFHLIWRIINSGSKLAQKLL